MKNKKDLPQLLKTREVIDILDISLATLFRLEKKGEIVPYRLGGTGHKRFNRDEVLALLRKRSK